MTADEFRQARLVAGLDVRGCAAALGLQPATIRSIECGARNPSVAASRLLRLLAEKNAAAFLAAAQKEETP